MQLGERIAQRMPARRAHAVAAILAILGMAILCGVGNDFGL